MCSCVYLVCVYHRQFRHCVSCRINLVSQHAHQDQTFRHRPLAITGFQKTGMFLFIKKAATISVFIWIITAIEIRILSALLLFMSAHDVQSQSRWVTHRLFCFIPNAVKGIFWVQVSAIKSICDKELITTKIWVTVKPHTWHEDKK